MLRKLRLRQKKRFSYKKKSLLNLIKHQRLDVNKFFLYVKEPSKLKYQSFVNGTEKVGIKQSKNSKAFIDCSQII